MKVRARFKKVRPEAVVPSFKKDRDSGFDFYSTHDGVIKFGEVTPVYTGLKLELDPDLFFKASSYMSKVMYGSFSPLDLTLELQVRPRSGLAWKEGITVVNSPGTVDNGYRNEIIVLLTRVIPGEYSFKKGDRIAQGVVVPVLSNLALEIVEVAEVNKTERNEGGHGHTGR